MWREIYNQQRQMTDLKLLKYEDVECLYLDLYKLDNPDITEDDIKNASNEFEDSEGKEYTLTFDEVISNIKKQGFWAHIGTKDKIIRYWIDKDNNLNLKELIGFFAHEIGHVSGTPIEDELKEEMRAEEYSYVASLAYDFATQVFKK